MGIAFALCVVSIILLTMLHLERLKSEELEYTNTELRKENKELSQTNTKYMFAHSSNEAIKKLLKPEVKVAVEEFETAKEHEMRKIQEVYDNFKLHLQLPGRIVTKDDKISEESQRLQQFHSEHGNVQRRLQELNVLYTPNKEKT